MTTVYQPQDLIIGPVVDALALIIQSQVYGVTVIYKRPPDGPPEDGSVLIPLSKFDILDDTNGKLTIKLTFGVRHYIVRGNFPDNISMAYAYFVPYLQAFAQWSNQDLGGLCQNLTITNGGTTQFVQSGQVFTALLVNISVKLEFNIPTN